jgi:hypothetical protein
LLTEILLAALAAGAGAAYGLDKLRPVVGSAKDLARLTDLTVLSIVGPAFPTQARRASRLQAWRVSLAIACLLGAFVVVVSLSRSGVRLSVPALTRHAQT